jgi:ubiquinone/menaquinone biosynthesis C-methylase UbiE
MANPVIPDFPWPVPPGFTENPVWTGSGFQIAGVQTPILSYRTEESGWTDALTEFHEETAGDNHFIDRASRQHALNTLEQLQPASPVILDIGCSSGFMLRALRQHLPRAFAIGSDYVRGPLEHITEMMPNVPLLHFDLTQCPLPDHCVDAVILLNVLEHIEDDVRAMGHVYRILAPGGMAVIEVPAGPDLYDIYDKTLLHHRRYSMRALCQLARGAGFRIVNQSHLGFFIYPGFWLTKHYNRYLLNQNKTIHTQVVAKNIQTTKDNFALGILMRVELALGRRVSYPFGIRCLMTCLKECE